MNITKSINISIQILIIIVRITIHLSIYRFLKCQCMLVSVIIDILHSISLGHNGNILVVAIEMETGIIVSCHIGACIIDIVNPGVSIVTCTHLCHRINIVTDCSGKCDGCVIIVNVTPRNVLFPYNHRIGGSSFGNP